MDHFILNGRADMKDDTFRQLLDVVSEKVLEDFVSYVVNLFKIPAGLWLYAGNEYPMHIEPETITDYLPEFCKNVRCAGTSNGKKVRCSDLDREAIHRFLRDVQSGNIELQRNYSVEKCHLGVKRMVFPIRAQDEIIGAFVAAKFRGPDPSEAEILQSRLRYFLNSIDIEDKTQADQTHVLTDLISDIPIKDDEEVGKLANRIGDMIPLISSFCRHNSPKGAYLQSILFLENLAKSFPDILVTEEGLWKATGDYLQKVMDRLRLKSAIVLYSERDSFTDLTAKAFRPLDKKPLDYLPLASTKEFLWLAERQEGVVLPRKAEGPLSWITEDVMNKLFLAKDAILYVRRVYDGKLLGIGYGFIDGIMLSSFERLLLKKSSLKLFSSVNRALASIETDYIMSETGHLLRRAVAKIENGLAEILAFASDALQVKDGDSHEVKTAKELAIPAVKIGLFRLDLIERNFKAFKNLREAKLRLEANQAQDEMEIVNVVNVLRETMEMFEPDMKQSGKKFEFDSSVGTWRLKTYEGLFRSVLLNLFDNAEKFAYRNTYVSIEVRKTKDHHIIKIGNLGIGIAPSERELVFDRYYQSIYRSPSKKRRGTGVGLHLCKLFMDLFYPPRGESIMIDSYPNKSRPERFEGDNYTTKVTLRFPIHQ